MDARTILKNSHPVYSVYCTNDLTIFEECEVNRDVKPNKEVINALRAKGFDIYCPLAITPQGILTNGNSRLQYMKMICEEDNIPINDSCFNVTFIIENTGEPLCERLKVHNLLARPWLSLDYFVSVCKQGNQNYIALANAMNESTIEVKRNKVKPLFSLGASVIIASHGFCRTAYKEFKNGKVPPFDIEFYKAMCNYVKEHHLEKAIGKTEIILALTEWFTYYYPTLDDSQREKFDNAINYYVGKGEATYHIRQFCSFVDIRKNDSYANKLRKEIINEHKRTKLFPIFK